MLFANPCILRSCDVIEWNWFWIMLPIFLTVVIAMAIWIITGLITCVALLVDDEEVKNNNK